MFNTELPARRKRGRPESRFMSVDKEDIAERWHDRGRWGDVQMICRDDL